MIVFFRKLPLSIKLLMIGIIPIIFLIFFSLLIFKEKSQNVKLIGNYIERMEQAGNLHELIEQLSMERRYSYQYAVKKVELSEVAEQRRKTDSIIRILEKNSDIYLADFTKYTFLQNLQKGREEIDTAHDSSLGSIVEFYTEIILRLNSLNTAIPGNTFLKPVYQDIVTQRILSEMLTYLGLIRANVFNSLYTKESNPQSILNILSIYKMYKSYEAEYLLKASHSSIALYNKEKRATEYGLVIAYLDKMSATAKFDNTYNVIQWWDICTKGISVINEQENNLSHSINARIQEIYQQEKSLMNITVFFLLFSLLFVIIFVSYTISDIAKLLRDIKVAARKISKGATGIELRNMPGGVIGNLAKSITRIDKNNLLMAEAASQIGKGNFDVIVNPRSDEDVLGISIKKMKRNLREFTAQKDKIQKETEELIYKRDEFFNIASHELKTPVTSLKAYTQLLLMDDKVTSDEHYTKILSKMDYQIVELTSLINDLLDTSKLQSGTIVYHKELFQLNGLVMETIEKIKQRESGYEFIAGINSNEYVNADRERIGQVITNFLTNAVKYGGNCHKIYIELDRKNDQLVCSVKDSGKGIAPEEQDKIFDRFYRISGKNMNTFPGLGLGLFISKEIIESQGGKIGVRSEVGKGSVFYFELPVSEESSQTE